MPIIVRGFTSWDNIYGWQPPLRGERACAYTTKTPKSAQAAANGAATATPSEHRFRFGLRLNF